MLYWFTRRLSRLAFITSTSHSTLPPFITNWSRMKRSLSGQAVSGLATTTRSKVFTRYFTPSGRSLRLPISSFSRTRFTSYCSLRAFTMSITCRSSSSPWPSTKAMRARSGSVTCRMAEASSYSRLFTERFTMSASGVRNWVLSNCRGMVRPL